MSQIRTDQIRDLVNQWEQLVGYQVPVPDWAIDEMANKGWIAGAFAGPGLIGRVSTLFDVGDWMTNHLGASVGGAAIWNGEQAAAMPWAKFGLSSTQYYSLNDSYSSIYASLTGTGPTSIVPFETLLANNRGVLTSATIQQALTSDKQLQATYGWLKYGLDFQQFQTQKLNMTTSFGRSLSDQEAVVQLQYLHQAQGSNQSAGVTPTLTQQERKQAQVGVGQSEVR